MDSTHKIEAAQTLVDVYKPRWMRAGRAIKPRRPWALKADAAPVLLAEGAEPEALLEPLADLDAEALPLALEAEPETEPEAAPEGAPETALETLEAPLGAALDAALSLRDHETLIAQEQRVAYD